MPKLMMMIALCRLWGLGSQAVRFAVGIAYLSKWYSIKSSKGRLLGVFGMGNMWEPLLTKFGAPFVMVAYGWQTVAQSLGGCPYSSCRLPILGVDEGRATDSANSRRSEGSPPQIYAGVS
jgi:hypothetical protein